jgi:hypothetical protein
MGGIQNGMVATDARARLLDTQCKDVKNDVYETLKREFPKLEVQLKLRQNQIPGHIGGCAPDGGVWFYDGVLICAFEAKKQQDAGNAIQRWYKNPFICRKINKDMSYVTFCTGEGAHPDGVIGKELHIAHLLGFNKYNPSDNSCYMKIDSFTESEIRNIMMEVIRERCKWVESRKEVRVSFLTRLKLAWEILFWK